MWFHEQFNQIKMHTLHISLGHTVKLVYLKIFFEHLLNIVTNNSKQLLRVIGTWIGIKIKTFSENKIVHFFYCGYHLLISFSVISFIILNKIIKYFENECNKNL